MHHNSYRIVSVKEGATTFFVLHTGSLTHDKTSRALAPFNAAGGVAFGGRCQVRAGGRTRCHTRRVSAIGTAGEGWKKRECASLTDIDHFVKSTRWCHHAIDVSGQLEKWFFFLFVFLRNEIKKILQSHQLYTSYHSRAAASRIPVWFLRFDRRLRMLHNWHSATRRCHSQHTGQTDSHWSGRRRINLLTGYLCSIY